MAGPVMDPPTRETLSSEYGFRVPEAFVTVVGAAYEATGGERGQVACFYDDICNMLLDSERGRYSKTPPELFPVGWMGVDGVHYGYVIHAPELEQEEYPMGELCPMDSDGVFLLGRDTREAFENLLSQTLLYWEDELEGLDPEEIDNDDLEEIAAGRQRIELVSRALKIEPRTDKAPRRYNSEGNGLPIVPPTPSGWLHRPSTDGIGVLAPVEAFRPGGVKEVDPHGPPEPFLREAESAVRDGFPATALFYLREAYWHHWTDRSMQTELARRMSDAYRMLGRPQLAEITLRTAGA
jgi:hypothetical protein